MHLLITRPGDDGARLADTLRQMGHDPILEPLLTIRNFDGPALDLADVQAILATSANGVRAIAGRTPERRAAASGRGTDTIAWNPREVWLLLRAVLRAPG